MLFFYWNKPAPATRVTRRKTGRFRHPPLSFARHSKLTGHTPVPLAFFVEQARGLQRRLVCLFGLGVPPLQDPGVIRVDSPALRNPPIARGAINVQAGPGR